MQRPRSLVLKVVAFFFAALAPGVLLVIPALLSAQPGVGVWGLGVISAIALGTALLGGVPAIIILERFHARKLRHYVLASEVLGLLLCILVIGAEIVTTQNVHAWASYAAQTVIVLILAAMPGTIYWLIVRPDRA